MKNWITGKNENIRYAHYNSGRIGLYLTIGLRQFGIGIDFYNHILSKGDGRIPKIILSILFLQINITIHK